MKKINNNNFGSSSSITPLYSYSSQSSPISKIFDNKNIDELIIKDERLLLKHSSTDYEKIKIVGKGSFGMAVLYKRKDDESFVILKEINLHELNNSERQMALNEVNLLSLLDHPHIIAFYDSFEEDGTLMIEMEYADGGTLSQLLASLTEPLIELEIIDMFEQMVNAVSYLHDHDILHRDLKTANIFLTKQRMIKVGDFGISKKMNIETKINGAQTILGTPYYLSPEMCEGKSYNEKSDIWALGCCFYEMCTLTKAFDADNLPSLLHKIINSEYEPLKKNYSQEVRLLIREMLRILPEQRPTSSELLDRVRYLCSSKEKKNFKNINKNNEINNSYSALYAFDILNVTLSSVQEFPKRIQIKQIAVNEYHQLLLTIQGQVYSWGDNSFGQLGHGDMKKRQFPTLIESLENKNVYKIAAGKKFSLFCAGRGIVLAAGKKLLSDNNDKYETKPKIVEALLTEDIVDICCGDEHSIALTETGEVFVWGKGKNGQLGTGNKNDVLIPIKIQIPTRQLIKNIICGPDSTMLITNSGNVLAMGSNKYNKLNLNQRCGFFKEIKNEQQQKQNKKKQIENALLPTAVRPFPRRVVSASLGNNHSGVLLENGNVHLFGLNSNGELGNGNTLPVTENNRAVKGLINKACMQLICGDGFTMIGTLDNEIYFWGLKGKEEEEENKNKQNIIINNKKREFKMAKTQEGWQLSTIENINKIILNPILILKLDGYYYKQNNNNINIGLTGLVCSVKKVFCVVDVENEQIKEEPIFAKNIKINKNKIKRRKSAPDNLSLCNTTTETWIRDELDDAEFIPYKPEKFIKQQSSSSSSLLLESEQKLREEIIQLRKQLQEQKNTFNGHEKQMSQLQLKLAELQKLLNKQQENNSSLNVEGLSSLLPSVNIPPPEYPGKKGELLKPSPLKNTFIPLNNVGIPNNNTKTCIIL